MQWIEAAVAQVNDLRDGEKRQVSVGDLDVLLIRTNGDFHAIGAYCTHYQAPLVDGVLSEDHIVCPWHNACFNVITGDQQEPPGLDSLSCYPVRIEGETVIVSVPQGNSGHRQPAMVAKNLDVDERVFVILGAGAAGTHAAETLRVAGYQGRLMLLTQDDRPPYDRTRLSKDYFIGKASEDQMPLRSDDFYNEHGIELQLNKQAVRVSADTKTIAFQDGETLTYDALLVATGGQPRQLQIPGIDLNNVFTLRTFTDTKQILSATSHASHAVVIGSSFIGMEAAAGLTQQGMKVTVVSPDSVPFEKILGKEIGSVFQQVHEDQGIAFRFGRKATRLSGNGHVNSVELDNGEQLPADLVVIGIGVQPATSFLEGVTLNSDDCSVAVDAYLCAADGLYVAGDIARYPDWRSGESVRIEHWRVAAQQGRVAAYNMTGQPTKFRAVPVFWTMQFGFPLRYVGHAEQWDDLIVDGDLQQQFIAYYIKGDQVLAAAGSQRDTEMAAIEELMQLDRMPSPDRFRQGAVDLVGELRRFQSWAKG